MNDICFSYHDTCGIPFSELSRIASLKNIETERLRLQESLQPSCDYKTVYASVQLPFDDDLLARVQSVIQQKEKLSVRVLLVIGIGGSSLGARAVLQAIQGRIVVPGKSGTLRIYFAETVDSDRMHTLLSICEQELLDGRNILVNVVTKSGTTTETIANFYVVLALLKRYRPVEYAQLVVVTTDAGSPLADYAQKENFTLLEIPKLVGGRYSVFSAVGLFPLGVAGIDLGQLRAGAAQMVQCCLDPALEKNPALMGALIHYYHYGHGIMMSDMFLFSVDLEGVGKWYRQLLAESIGKEFDTEGKQVLVGITPTVSLGSIDLHSVAQLSLGGPRDKYTTFVTVQKSKQTIVISEESFACKGKAFSEVMDALVEGTKRAYLKNGRPFCSIVLSEKNEWSIGQFLQLKMMETIYLGFLLDINPFDQPNVELYKREAQKILLK